MTAETDTAAPSAYPSAARAWALVAVFFITSVVSVIDRGIITLVVDPIRHDLAISDVQISLLQGLAFGIFYAVVGIPLGLSADRLSRMKLLMFGISVWSLATLFGGFSAHYGHLFASRLLVGLGEATLAPCAVSMIGDMFPPNKRGAPNSVYLMGQAVSGGLSIWITGVILKAVPAGVFRGWPVIDGLAPWRVVFILCGLMGFVAVIMLTLFREPTRRGVAAGGGGRVKLADAAQYLRSQWGVFLPFYLGFAVLSMSTYGLNAWSATYLIRHFHLPRTEVGMVLGVVTMIAGAVGAVIGGSLVDWTSRRGVKTGKFLILMGASWCSLPAALSVFAPTPAIALFMIGFGVAAAPLVGATMVSGAQEMVPNNMRGVAVALFGLMNTLLGFTAGPFLIAYATEHLFHDPAKVGFAIMTVMIPAEAVGFLLFAFGYASMRKAMATTTELRRVVEGQS